MVDIPKPPKSPTLQPPRKSVELEDPGAHDLGKLNTPHGDCLQWNSNLWEGSENEEDVFADAQEGHNTASETASVPHSPVPITRVEKVYQRAIEV